MLADAVGVPGSAGGSGGIAAAAQQDPAEGLQVLAAGVGISQHRLEMVETLVIGSRQHQSLPQQQLAGPLAPEVTAVTVEALGPEGQQVKTAAEHPQPSVARELVLELATTANGPIEHGSDALQAQLSQTQPELEHLRRSRALQSGLAAVAAPRLGSI